VALKDEDSGVRKGAAEALVKIGSPSVNPLIVALKDKDSDVRKSAVEALAKIGSPSVNPLIVALKDRDAYARGNAAESLGKIKDNRAVDPLIGALKDKEPYVRGRAAVALGEVRDGRAVNPLIGALKDEDSYVRESAAWALGGIGDSRAVDPLITALKGKELPLRVNAAEALGKIKDSRAVDPLIAALKDKELLLRANAAESLGKIKDSRAVDPLIEVLKKNDEDPEVRRRASMALGEIGKPALEPLIAALEDENSSVRSYAAEALGFTKDTRAVEPLIVALGDEEPGVRWDAAVALGKIGDSRAVESLIVALEDEGANIRGSAAEALGNIGDNHAVEPLIATLGDEDWSVRRSAVDALGKIKDNRAVDPLIEALKDKGWDYRNYAAMALGEIGDERAIGPLIEALNDDNSDVRRVAAEALKKITGQDFGEGQAKWREWWKKTKIAQLAINYPEIMEIEWQREIVDRSPSSYTDIKIPNEEGFNDEIFIFFNEENKIIRAETVSHSETMRIERGFYYWDEELIFVFEIETNYMTDEEIENSYYFHNGKLILWLDNNGQEIPVTEDQSDYILSISDYIFESFERQGEYQADQYEEPLPDQPGADDQLEDDVPADPARTPAITGIYALADIGGREVPYDGYSPGSCNNVPSLEGIIVEITVEDVGPGDRIRITLSGSNSFTTDEEAGYSKCDDSELGEVASEESSLARRGSGKLLYIFNAGWMCVIEVRAELWGGQHNDTWSERFYLGECAE
jgi:HEAT repeat protein